MTAVDPIAAQLADVRSEFSQHGQDHVFAHWETLGAEAREALLAQAARVDLAALEAAHTRLQEPTEVAPLEPAPADRLPSAGGDSAFRARAHEAGSELLAEGAVAALVMAGGQGTRLGFPGPKGSLPLGPVSERSLFALHAQKLHGVARRHGRPVPWLLMTSSATEAPTQAILEASDHFGLAPDDVWCFRQASVPCLDPEGRLLLAEPGRIAEAPDGHGGALPALVSSGLLERLRARGVRFLSTYQVDNPLARPADALFLGVHALREAEMSCKVVAKLDSMEPAGTVGLRGGRAHVVEYTEIDPSHRERREPDGGLSFWAASIGMHVLDLDLIERVGSEPDRWLPLHPSAKKIPRLGPAGAAVVPDAPNGYKLERFIFDALAAADGTALLEVQREEEYAPIKSPSGSQSPQAARRALVSCARRWLEAAGVGGIGPESWIEVDHARIDSECDARRAGLGHVSEASGWILLRGGEAT